MSLYYYLKRRLFPSGAVDFTPQFRLEGRARTTDSDSSSLAMRTADPLWMLCRQWQFGEFQAEDNGSPIQVTPYFKTETAESYSVRSNGQRFPLNGVPLEAKVEAMPVTGLDLKSRVRIGQKFEGLIRQYLPKQVQQPLINSFRSIFKLEYEGNTDKTSLRFFKLMQGKVADGNKIIKAIEDNLVPWKNGNSTPNKELREEVAPRLQSWYKQLYVVPVAEAAWNQHYLSHQFKVHNAANNVRLNAPDYQAGHLDWFSFDHTETVPQNIPDGALPAEEQYIPLNVSFPSMPAKRLFAFEDSSIDLTKMDVEPGEILKLMLLDFALISGCDWYTVPLDMQVGQMCWVKKIEVTDVFGVTSTIENNEEKGGILNEDGLKVWDIFKIRNNNDPVYKEQEHFLFIAPAVTRRLESEPLEELLFVRDEYANMVWAIERQVTNAMGKPVDGYGLHNEINGSYLQTTEESGNASPKYRLASPVPSNWIPFKPKHIDESSDQIELVRAVMLDVQGNMDTPKALSWLANYDLENIREEAIPKAGVRVQVTNQRVRWNDGKTYVWRGRKVLAGRGEGNSGLRFDFVEELKP